MRTGLAPRDLVSAAVRAGKFGAPVAPELERDIANGADVPFEALNFDSLGWMEFCISIELDCGVELTPSIVAEMRSLADVEAWLAGHLQT